MVRKCAHDGVLAASNAAIEFDFNLQWQAHATG